MRITKLVLISIILVFALSGCSAIDFINCGDSGMCFEGRKYGCNGSEKCLKLKKANCLKEHRTWNEEYGFCER
jgi:hypothetical protein